jgi:hypothetical protein
VTRISRIGTNGGNKQKNSFLVFLSVRGVSWRFQRAFLEHLTGCFEGYEMGQLGLLRQSEELQTTKHAKYSKYFLNMVQSGANHCKPVQRTRKTNQELGIQKENRRAVARRCQGTPLARFSFAFLVRCSCL